MAENMPLPEPFTGESGIGPHDLIIDVLGARFSITAGEDPAYLDEVLAQYRFAVSNTQGIWGMKDPLKVAIMTGFLLCDEINKLRLQYEEGQVRAGEAERVIGNLIARIEQVVENPSLIDD